MGCLKVVKDVEKREAATKRPSYYRQMSLVLSFHNSNVTLAAVARHLPVLSLCANNSDS